MDDAPLDLNSNKILESLKSNDDKTIITNGPHCSPQSLSRKSTTSASSPFHQDDCIIIDCEDDDDHGYNEDCKTCEQENEENRNEVTRFSNNDKIIIQSMTKTKSEQQDASKQLHYSIENDTINPLSSKQSPLFNYFFENRQLPSECHSKKNSQASSTIKLQQEKHTDIATKCHQQQQQQNQQQDEISHLDRLDNSLKQRENRRDITQATSFFCCNPKPSFFTCSPSSVHDRSPNASAPSAARVQTAASDLTVNMRIKDHGILKRRRYLLDGTAFDWLASDSNSSSDYRHYRYRRQQHQQKGITTEINKVHHHPKSLAQTTEDILSHKYQQKRQQQQNHTRPSQLRVKVTDLTFDKQHTVLATIIKYTKKPSPKRPRQTEERLALDDAYKLYPTELLEFFIQREKSRAKLNEVMRGGANNIDDNIHGSDILQSILLNSKSSSPEYQQTLSRQKNLSIIQTHTSASSSSSSSNCKINETYYNTSNTMNKCRSIAGSGIDTENNNGIQPPESNETITSLSLDNNNNNNLFVEDNNNRGTVSKIENHYYNGASFYLVVSDLHPKATELATLLKSAVLLTPLNTDPSSTSSSSSSSSSSTSHPS